MPKPQIFVVSDHRGFPVKDRIVGWLKERDYPVQDLGSFDETRCDGSDYAAKMAAEMKADSSALGIAVCGTGQVMAMAANRFQHLRAALCTNATMARLARAHNHANVLAMGAHISGIEVILDCVDTFLKTECLGDRYAERVKKFTAMGGL